MRPYTPQEFQAKAQIDIALFSELFSNYLTESDVPAFTQMLIKAYDLAQELHEESNVVPQLSVTSLRSKKKLQTLTENEINQQFYNAFRERVNKKFVEPLERGKLLSIHENDIGKIIRVIVNSDTELDPEISKKYGIFEKTIYESLKDIILPRDTILNIKDYAEKVQPDYFNIFDRNIKTVKAEFNEAVDVLVKNLALKMFKCAIKFADNKNSDDYKLDDYKGISTLINDKDELDLSLDKINVTKPTLDEDELEELIK